jgi:hypothetical protein
MHGKLIKSDASARYHAVWLLLTIVLALSFVAMTIVADKGGVIKGADQAYYFSYVRSIVIDRDIHFANEYAHFGLATHEAGLTGYPINKYSIGLPLLVAPFYIIAHAAISWLSWAGYAVDATGYSLPYQYAFSLGSIFYGYLGLVCAYKICRRFFSAESSFVAVTAMLASSNVLYYFLREPFMAHLASFFAVSLFIYCWIKIRYDRRADAVNYLALGLAGGFMVLVRQQDAAFFVVPAVDLAFSFVLRKHARPRVGLREVFSFALGFMPIAFIQILAWKIIYGSYLTYSYGAEPFIYAGSPRIIEVLFSSRHGLISWTPVISLALAGLFVSLAGRREARLFAGLFIIAFLIQLYINASWHMWWFGYAFGARGFIGCTAVFAFGLAGPMDAVKDRRGAHKFFILLFIALAMWNMVMITAYMAEMIPYGDYFSWIDFLSRLDELPDAALRKIGSGGLRNEG